MRGRRPASELPQILLYGPNVSGASGMGGYVRNMRVYLDAVRCEETTLAPMFHSVRGDSVGLLNWLPVRFVRDCYAIIRDVLTRRPAVIHVLAQYRSALPREAFLALVCKISRIKLVYDIKAGMFQTAYTNRGTLYRALTRFIIQSADAILVEGVEYIGFLHEQFGREGHYFPNFVPVNEIPATVPDRLTSAAMKVLFVGRCYAGKGADALLKGCAAAAESGATIVLTLIGEEDDAFHTFANEFSAPPNLKIERMGGLAHDLVRAAMLDNDVFCFPTRHPGEGHSNAINEAAMSGMIIVTSRHGFIPTVLSEEGGYFLHEVSPAAICEALNNIASNPERAREVSRVARLRLLSRFTSDAAAEMLCRLYRSL